MSRNSLNMEQRTAALENPVNLLEPIKQADEVEKEMTNLENNQAEKVNFEDIVIAQCGTVEEAEVNEIIEENTMLELDVVVEYGDQTYHTEYELQRFLATLTEAQLAETEVLVDDDSFVVFYPLMPACTESVKSSGHHFDTDTPRPTVKSASVPEPVGILADQFPINGILDRDAALAVLLASVRL
ncbi:MAG TPA: hypothetical protein VH186_12375 [Chloroflexia bacterium]|nr:hypothetical protein [Chloroflexia bacterium]